MLEDIRKIVRAGGYDLADLLHRIDVLYAAGRLSDGERETLYSEAREGAEPSGGYAPLEQRVEELERWSAEIDAWRQSMEGDQEGEPDDYPPWRAPTNAKDAYYTGMGMTYTDGKRYVNISPEGYGCCYGPDVLPDHWRLVDDGEMPQPPEPSEEA